MSETFHTNSAILRVFIAVRSYCSVWPVSQYCTEAGWLDAFDVATRFLLAIPQVGRPLGVQPELAGIAEEPGES